VQEAVGEAMRLFAVATLCGLLVLAACTPSTSKATTVATTQATPSAVATKAPTPAPTPTPTPAPTSVVQGNRAPPTGEQGRISVESEFIFAATSQANYDDFSKVLIAKDQIGAAQMMYEGRLYMVDNGTKVLVLGRGGFLSTLMNIRVLEGKQFGRSLWMPYEFVNRI
jgi:hypothetical protein